MAKPKSLKEWVELYEKKTGNTAEVSPDAHLLYLAERGYAVFREDVDGKMIIVDEACGDGKFWHDVAELMATGLGFDCVCARFTRNVESYIRAFGWEIEKKYIYFHPAFSKESEYRYLIRDEQNRPLVVTFSGYDDNGSSIYWGTHYLKTTEPPPLTVREGARNMGGDEAEIRKDDAQNV